MIAETKIMFIGGGHLTEIMLTRLADLGHLASGNVVVSSRGKARLQTLEETFNVSTATDNVHAARNAALILINVRPEDVDGVIVDLDNANLTASQLVVSLAAGVPLSRYAHLHATIARALPNPPSQIGSGVGALVVPPNASTAQRQLIQHFFEAFGTVIEVAEAHLDLITALSSPVATYLFIQSLIDAGVRGGLSHDNATQIATQTVAGSLALLTSNDMPLAARLQQASTPGGISVETLYTLEKHAFKATIMDAIAQGTLRANELGQR